MVALGDLVWTYQMSQESANYESSLYPPPIEPWQGKITNILLNKDGSIYAIRVSRFDKATGKPDLDSNATSFCRASEYFLSREEAVIFYHAAVRRTIAGLEYQIAEYEGSLKQYPLSITKN